MSDGLSFMGITGFTTQVFLSKPHSLLIIHQLNKTKNNSANTSTCYKFQAMIRMIQCNSAGQAKAYFTDALSKSDYFINDQELPGKLHGILANRLGLGDEVSKDIFFGLCENINPITGNTITPRSREKRKIGYDINFHCSKSVSLIHALSKDNHIMDAFELSVAETMKDIEIDSMARVRKNGLNEDRKTGELVWANFIHQTARPVDNLAPDPHLHSHCFVFNMTWDETEQTMKAGEFGNIKKDMPYYQAMFHKRLSDKLIQQGYQIKRTDKSFEIDGVPDKAIELFSKRTNEIGQFAKKHSITNKKEMAELGARTRSKKQKGLSMTDLKKLWRRQITGVIHFSEKDWQKPLRFDKSAMKSSITTTQCIDYTIGHSFERASVLPQRRMLASAIIHSIGHGSINTEKIHKAFFEDNRIISVKEKGRTLCTTEGVLHEEREMVKLAQKGNAQLIPLYNSPPVLTLDGQQAKAISQILTTSDRVSIIRGVAGAGKTTLMKEAVSKIEKAGKKVIVVAPTAEASKGVLVQEGFDQADTVAGLLIHKQRQAALRDQVLWVDEAGLLGVRDMKNLLCIVDKMNAQLILSGDIRQHTSVTRGDALRILTSVAGIKTAEVSKIYRQKNEHYRNAVHDLSKGKVKAAFEKLDELGVIESIDYLNPNDKLTQDYIALLEKRKSALIISPTHKQGEELTDAIRTELKKRGLINKKEVGVLKLTNLNLTDSQKRDNRNYKDGQVIQFVQNLPGIKRGSSWTVKNASQATMRMVNEKGKELLIPTDKSSSFDLFQQSEIKISKGDKIKITRNKFDEQKKRLNNGQSLEVVKIDKDGSITVTNRASKAVYEIGNDFGHLCHAYCMTSYAAQGKTVDHVLIAQPSSTFTASNAKQFYVSVSRGRVSVKIYTDDKHALLDNIIQLGDRPSAIELVHEKYCENEILCSPHRKRESFQQPILV